ncbi:hypothetical protein Sango_2696300 [Sesamum angolense]|uniref:Uncharacterized protein n=1 Tax=Sesamum angolense TaxID=2727404 RepID=A0AAE1W2W2_9LAMI|nr:hypothetical protein Sango_2696300 [Sesamum angolense]
MRNPTPRVNLSIRGHFVVTLKSRSISVIVEWKTTNPIGFWSPIPIQDAQIARLINKVDNVDASHVMGKQVEAHDEVEAPVKQHYTKKDKYAKEFQISSDGLIPVVQLKEFIEGTIRSNIEGSSKSSFTYSKPYTPRIDSLKMPMGYQLPKFQQFDGALQNKGETRSKEKGQALFKSSKQRINGSERCAIQAQKHCKRNITPKTNVPYERSQRKLTLKEMQAREYPFLDSDVPGIFDDLLEANLINLL